jgi:hypothetical protein
MTAVTKQVSDLPLRTSAELSGADRVMMVDMTGSEPETVAATLEALLIKLYQDTAQYAGSEVARTWVSSVPDLLTNTVLTYTVGELGAVAAGDIVRTLEEGCTYKVADAAAQNHHVATVGGAGGAVKLYVLPSDDGTYNARAFGALGDGVTDDAPAIQKAIDHVGGSADLAGEGGTIVFPCGEYAIGATVRSYGHVSLRGAGPTPNPLTVDPAGYAFKKASTFTALPGVTTMLDLYPDPTHAAKGAHRRGFSVYDIRFDGNGTADRGIDISDTVSAVIKGNTFVNFAEGGAAIWGGGAIYTTIQLNNFSGPFYALDSQDSYSANPQIYYGINVGDFDKNIVSAHYGVRFEGILNFTNNDFEMQIKSRAAIDINSVAVNSYCSIVGNYFEGTVDTGGELVAIRCEKMTGRIHDNRLYGDPGQGTAIKLDDSLNYSIDVRGNQMAYWNVGIAAKSPGNGNAFVNRINIGPNNYNPANVTTYITGGPGAALFIGGAANNVDDAQPAQYKHGLEEHVFSGGVYHGAVRYGLVTEISLRKGNFFKFVMSGTATVDTVRHAEPGHRFSVMAKFAESITLANSAFNLACGADFVLPANVALLFEVDPDGVVREVGRTSAVFSVVTPGALVSAGHIEIAPDLFVEVSQLA